ncbi:hypothetical protein DT73_13145 [Mangrovibacter sp. MFB070]|uniref:COG3904 family protein n=1 Tax=Mangrovibacter sp. MFB070 TaxID=1224318 RepID=UPI0004D82260|nr:hypothetical protein [Mangrovibacter sp. MFB070]KEA51874.1 hypothetical protein DT73_13145 [Mangrovibacter sp. MFB070]
MNKLSLFVFFIFISLIPVKSFSLTRVDWNYEENGPLCPYMGYGMCISLKYSGDIQEGDYKKLNDFITNISKLNPKTRIGVIYLNSNGGDLYESFMLGKLIREHKIQVVIPMNSHCYSSCVFVLAAGVGRLSFGDVGIHSFYSVKTLDKNFNYDEEDKVYQKTLNDIRNYLNYMRVSQKIVDMMLTVPSSNLHILSSDELKETGLLGIDPLFQQYLVSQGMLKPPKVIQ